MSEARRSPARFRRRASAVFLAIGLVVGLVTAATSEERLIRQLKVDVFDQNWSAVLDDCDELLARYPDSPARVQAAFYRTRALARLPGREGEAIEALRRFLRERPVDRLLVEEAWSGLFSIACAPGRPDGESCRQALRSGLADSTPFVSTLAAIRAADVDDRSIRRQALPLLKKAYETQIDPDIRNEILIAILKIDPDEVPDTMSDREPSARRPRGDTGKPSVIRMIVFNKTEERFELKVRFPLAFARMLIDSLGEDRKDELRREARRQGMNIDSIFEAIRKSGTGRLLEVDTEESRIEIWID